MRFYTKEWYTLDSQLGMAEMFEPVIDKEYSDEEFSQLYQAVRDMYIEEERAEYDEPPLDLSEAEDIGDIEDFDPEDYLIGEIDEDGDTYDLRNPGTYEELVEFEKKMAEFAWREYESREPFDEEEAGRDFDEDYEDNLAEPDEDIPAWIRESVDPRLIALWRLPEKVYRKYVAEEAVLQARFDRLDEAADEALEKMIEAVPPKFDDLMDELDEHDGDYVTAIRSKGENIEIDLLGWDDEGDEAKFTMRFKDAEVIEDDGVSIEVTVDEDGDTESSCDLMYHEVYFENGAIEVHLLMDDGEPKYFTLRCKGIKIS